MRATMITIVATLAACSPADADETEAAFCVENVIALLDERAEFLETGAADLLASSEGALDSEALLDVQHEQIENGQEADISAALSRLRVQMETMPLSDMQPYLEFIEGLDMRENRIRFALLDCPAAASVKPGADRQLPVRIVTP